MSDHLSKERAEEILAEALPGANTRRSLCGGCARWSDSYSLGDLADSPPGWTRPTGEFGWASPPLCPSCQKKIAG